MKTSNIVLSMFMLFGILLVMLGLKMISFGTFFFISVILGIIYWVLIAKSIKNAKKSASPDTKVKENDIETKVGEAKAEQAKAEQVKAEQAKAE
ncbi:hypothetical protein KAR10_09850, partial [bacterium]|nr:hypothetical protein [bacterium]